MGEPVPLPEGVPDSFLPEHAGQLAVLVHEPVGTADGQNDIEPAESVEPPAVMLAGDDPALVNAAAVKLVEEMKTVKEIRAPRLDPLDPAAEQSGFEPAADGFDFGQFGHGNGYNHGTRRRHREGPKSTKRSRNCKRVLNLFASLATTMFSDA